MSIQYCGRRSACYQSRIGYEVYVRVHCMKPAPSERQGCAVNHPRLKARVVYYLLMSQTSCYRYWGEGLWADRGRELCRRTMDTIDELIKGGR
jgi:hypothetical protein